MRRFNDGEREIDTGRKTLSAAAVTQSFGRTLTDCLLPGNNIRKKEGTLYKEVFLTMINLTSNQS
jgi:hypothetical protein